MTDEKDYKGMSPHDLARSIREARDRGDYELADFLVHEFNLRLPGPGEEVKEKGAPIAPILQAEPPAQTAISEAPPEAEEIMTPKPQYGTLAASLSGKVEGDNKFLSSLKAHAKAIPTYPEEIQPLLKSILEDLHLKLQMPGAVLEPQLTESFDALFKQKVEQESLLKKMEKTTQMRSVLLRYREALLESIIHQNT